MTSHYFDDLEEQRLLQEDGEAWRSVCGILLSIVSIGVGIAVLALLIIL